MPPAPGEANIGAEKEEEFKDRPINNRFAFNRAVSTEMLVVDWEKLVARPHPLPEFTVVTMLKMGFPSLCLKCIFSSVQITIIFSTG